MHLVIKRPDNYDGRFPVFRKPSEIGYFSLDTERQFHSDNHQLKYISIPRNLKGLSMDLNVGYHDAIRKDFAKKEKIDILLTWILHNQDKVKNVFYNNDEHRMKIDFVCFRGLLTNICSSLYENREGFIICATKFNSIIYLCAFETDEDIHRRETATERDKLMSSWGYKFEQYMVADSPNGVPDLSVPVNEKEEYCIVLKGRLSNHTLLYSAEVDGIDPSYSNNKDSESTKCYIELKTSRMITSDRQYTNFCRYKLLKWWLQSFLVGIPTVICGFRNDHGIVKNLEIFNVLDMPKKAQNLWSPSSCLNFCSEFLGFIKTCVIKDDPSIVYKFVWKPSYPITCEELTAPGEFQVLPDWYISNVRF